MGIIQVAILHLQKAESGADDALPQIARLEEFWHSEAFDQWNKLNQMESPVGSAAGAGASTDDHCWDFIRGFCRWGAKCYYVHDAQQQRLMGPIFPSHTAGEESVVAEEHPTKRRRC